MKLQGFLKGVGKIENIVVSQTGGVTIARAYQPNVSNPKTEKQVDQRARLKLASQIAAAMSPVIAIPKNGLVSSRNEFIKKNMDLITSLQGTAQMQFAKIQLTNGSIPLPAVSATFLANNHLDFELASDPGDSVSRIVYSVFKKNADGQLQFFKSYVTEDPGVDKTYLMDVEGLDGEVAIYAYGIKDLSSAAKVKYDNYNIASGTDIAKLVSTRTMSASDYQFTKTSGTTAKKQS